MGKENEASQNLASLLDNDIDLLDEIIEFYPETTNFPRILDVIENFKSDNEF